MEKEPGEDSRDAEDAESADVDDVELVSRLDEGSEGGGNHQVFSEAREAGGADAAKFHAVHFVTRGEAGFMFAREDEDGCAERLEFSAQEARVCFSSSDARMKCADQEAHGGL